MIRFCAVAICRTRVCRIVPGCHSPCAPTAWRRLDFFPPRKIFSILRSVDLSQRERRMKVLLTDYLRVANEGAQQSPTENDKNFACPNVCLVFSRKRGGCITFAGKR